MTINDPMLWRLFWKEYRAQRAFWLAVAGFALALMLVLLPFVTSSSDRLKLPYVIALSMPLLYAWGCAAMLFAAEREEGTWELLRILATTPARTFAAKLSLALVGTVGMIGLLLLAAWGISSGRIPDIGSLPANPAGHREPPHELVRLAYLYAEIFIWGLLFSAIVRKVLSAVCLAVAVPLTLKMLMNIVTGSAWDYDLVLLPMLLAASYVLVHRYLSGRSQAWSFPLQWVPKEKTGELEQLAAVRETTPPRMLLFKRLLWQEWRQVPRVGLAVWGAVVGLLFVIGYPIPNPDTPLALPGLTVVSLLMGVWVFRAEQDGHQFRFLADRGASPRSVWLCKQLVWLPLTLATAAPFILIFAIADTTRGQHFPGWLVAEIRRHNPTVSVMSLAMLCVGLSYGTGQFLSMLIPRTITAGFMGLILSWALITWMWAMTMFQVPPGISAMPLFVILVAATLGWSRNWLLERTTWQRWLRFLGLIGMGLVTVWGCVGVYRVYEIPGPTALGLPPLTEPRTAVAPLFRPATPEEAETAAIYRQAIADLKFVPKFYEDLRTWQNATVNDRRFLAENGVPLQRTILATRRAHCAFVNPSNVDEWQNTGWEDCFHLSRLLLLSARKLESEQKLDEALGRYIAALRLARHVASRASSDPSRWWQGWNIEREACSWMDPWAALPGQTPERIDEAVRRVTAELSQFPPLTDAIRMSEHRSRMMLDNGDWSSGRLSLPRCFFPWERTRAVRILNVMSTNAIHSAEIIEQTLATPGRSFDNWSGNKYDERFLIWLETTPALCQLRYNTFVFGKWEILWPETLRRGLVLKLALLAWKKRHGQLPERLEQLAGKVPDYVLRDPYTGQKFNYRPNGFPAPVTLGRRPVKAAQPLFWSGGPTGTDLQVVFKIP